MELKTRVKTTAPAEICVGCTKEIIMNYNDCAVENRIGVLSSRHRNAEFVPQKRRGVMSSQCFAVAIGLGEVL